MRLQKLGSIALLTCLCFYSAPPLLMSALPAAQSLLEGRNAEALRINQWGFQQLNLMEFSAAFQSFQQALATARAAGDRVTEGAALNNIGLAYRVLGEYPHYFQPALVIARELGDRTQEETILANIQAVNCNLEQSP